MILIEPILLPQLQGLIRSYPDKMILWQDIKSEIELLNNLPRHRGREKKQRALELAKKLPLLSDFLQTSILLLKEYMNITQLLFQYMNAHVEPLEDAALQYFDVLFEKQNKTIIKKTFTPKTSGDQLGRKLIIAYCDSEKKEHNISYFIKTHQHGSRSDHSGSFSLSASPVDLKELFVYKVFEYLGIGPKTHFFFNPLSRGGFFIATQDLGFTKRTDKTKFFLTFSKINETLNLTKIEEEKIKGLARIDLITRIFLLTDVTSNSANFGCVSSNQSKEKWKIIDFRLETQKQYIDDKIYEGFVAGNGRYGYMGVLRLAIIRHDGHERLNMGKNIINEFNQRDIDIKPKAHKLAFTPAIECAYEEIINYSKQNLDRLGINIHSNELVFADLLRYKEDVKTNMKCLENEINLNLQTLRVDAFKP
ncbi:MAG: hypothetical protein ACK4PR_10895 [Gammaproteobacteria bacterium]